jgi:hypothetical protein
MQQNYKRRCGYARETWRRLAADCGGAMFTKRTDQRLPADALGSALTALAGFVDAVGGWVFFYQLLPATRRKTLEQIEQHWRPGKSPREP